jgi:hypothetical protein
LGHTAVESTFPVHLSVHFLFSLPLRLLHIDAAQDPSRQPPKLPKVRLPFATQEQEAPGNALGAYSEYTFLVVDGRKPTNAGLS